MKAFIALVLGCASAFAADTDAVRVVTTAKTNAQSKAVTTIDTFTRSGQTNLVRHTKLRAGAVQIREGVFVDAFTCTNGVFSPVESSRISTANATSKAVRQEMDRYTNP